VEAARAVEKQNRLRLTQTRVLAPGDGIITSRTATVGAVVPAGQELFRMIKDGRLEWRAEISAADLERLRPGQVAKIVQDHESIQGELRMVAPTIDTETLSGMAYVDLPRGRSLRAGAFVRGYFEVGNGLALTLPQSAVLLRDGFHYVMCVGPKSDVIAKKVSVGRRAGDRIEITQGLSTSEIVIASGLSFLSDGDTVRVVDELRSSDIRMPTTSNPARSSVEATARGGS
jgi:RND family efflux transporter MFP subunit